MFSVPLQSAQFSCGEGEAPPLAGSALSKGGERWEGDGEGQPSALLHPS